jgi:hypothetical protein
MQCVPMPGAGKVVILTGMRAEAASPISFPTFDSPLVPCRIRCALSDIQGKQALESNSSEIFRYALER